MVDLNKGTDRMKDDDFLSTEELIKSLAVKGCNYCTRLKDYDGVYPHPCANCIRNSAFIDNHKV